MYTSIENTYTVSVLNSFTIQYRNRIKFLQAKMPFVRRFWSDSSEQLEEVYQRKMTGVPEGIYPIIARLVLAEHQFRIEHQQEFLDFCISYDQ